MDEDSFVWVVDVGLIVVADVANKVLSQEDVLLAIKRHAAADWGEVTRAEQLMDERIVRSRFTLDSGEVLLILTDLDARLTLIMVEREI
ncbi:hypothetical protein [Planctomicrobium sp. SH527]|uniref:hypothetical protein n=1 Tax=Planctomicrobium sp. SH527 TaxID=3448123 RepID=UPI003F5C5AD8